MKEIKGNVVDLSNLAKTPGEKGEAEAIEFIKETREAMVVIFQHLTLFDQGMQDAYNAIQYLRGRVNQLEKEVKILKGEDLNDGIEKEGHAKTDQSGAEPAESLNDGEAPTGRKTGTGRQTH